MQRPRDRRAHGPRTTRLGWSVIDRRWNGADALRATWRPSCRRRDAPILVLRPPLRRQGRLSHRRSQAEAATCRRATTSITVCDHRLGARCRHAVLGAGKEVHRPGSWNTTERGLELR
jgi:hypothetical protein